MSNAAKSRAKELFDAMQKKKSDQVVTDRDEEFKRRAQRTAELRALRLAREASQLEAGQRPSGK